MPLDPQLGTENEEFVAGTSEPKTGNGDRGTRNSEQLPITVACEGETLIGMLHLPGNPGPRGVLVVVGGPQYRVGSHRQFLLLARDLAASGIPVMRFDYRGMGDSEGAPVSFEQIAPDIEAALGEFLKRCKGLKEVVLWGLCDAASAISFYGHRDPRVTGLVLLNPWVRSDEGQARAYVKHYYWARLLSREFWGNVVRGRWNVAASARSFLSDLDASLRRSGEEDASSGKCLANRMAEGLEKFEGRVLLVLSGNDLTAAEFRDATALSSLWQRALNDGRLDRRDLDQANHTFSRRGWRDQVSAWTREWVLSW